MIDHVSQPTMTTHPTRRSFLKAAAVSAAALSLRSRADANAAGPWELGCYTRPWDAFEYRVALDGIAESGFTHAGLMTAKGKTWVMITLDTTEPEAAEIGSEAARRGLKVSSVYGDFPIETTRGATADNLLRLIDLARSAGSPRLLLGGVGAPEKVEPYYRAVADCCDRARDRGLSLSVKPHGGQNATGAACAAIVARVDHPNFGVWYDPGNIFYYSNGSLDPVADAPSVAGHVFGMSVKDFLPPREVLVTPGTGRVDFPAVLKALAAGGFRAGPLIVECLAKKDTPQAITAEAKIALANLRKWTASP
jgi:sugar phosphate isomerase/epimerase